MKALLFILLLAFAFGEEEQDSLVSFDVELSIVDSDDLRIFERGTIRYNRPSSYSYNAPKFTKEEEDSYNV